ncbi:MAG: glycosyltransferase family 2 protein [Dehalococcoidia bacterium]|nr:glycosyltransferase family 2 protein [Dehalococcoidia bacterium]
MKTLGVSMIVKNEAAMIENCLNSLKGVDEIVIVDTGSEDDTVEICKKYTDKVYTDYKWNDDFAEARNVSLDRCTTDFVLIIDADEILGCEVKAIKEMFRFMVKQVEKHTIKYMGMIFNVQTDAEKVESIRLIRRDPRIKWESAIHNMLTLDGSNDLLHSMCYKTQFLIQSGFSPAHLMDPDRSLRILKHQLELHPENTRYMYYIAREYINRVMHPENRANKATLTELLDNIIFWLEKYDEIRFKSDVWLNETSDAEYCLALAYIEKYNLTKDKEWWHKSMWAAQKSFMVLPSNQNTADFISGLLLNIPPVGVSHLWAAKFWQGIADRCDNFQVAQVRPRTRLEIDKLIQESKKNKVVT